MTVSPVWNILHLQQGTNTGVQKKKKKRKKSALLQDTSLSLSLNLSDKSFSALLLYLPCSSNGARIINCCSAEASVVLNCAHNGTEKVTVPTLHLAFAVSWKKSSKSSVPVPKASWYLLVNVVSLIYFKIFLLQAGTDCTGESSFKMLPLQPLHSCFVVLSSNSSCLLIGSIKRLGKQ